MNSTFERSALLAAPLVLAFATVVEAQQKAGNYPVRPIRIIISVAPGAGAEMIARATAQMLHEHWGQNVVVEPRPGGGGVIATEIAARATPDGYTFYQNGFGLLMQGALKRVPLEPLKAFEPMVRSTQQPYIMIGHHSLPTTGMKELIALSAGKPLTYAGSSGVGSSVHIGGERFARISGMKVKHVPYKGSAPAILALMGGEINLAIGSAMASIGAIKTGKVKPVANLGLARLPALPDLPTVAEQGFPGFSVTNAYNLWTPAGTPKAIIAEVNRVVTEGMNAPDMVKRLAASGAEPATRLPHEKLKAELVAEYAEIQRTVKELKLN